MDREKIEEAVNILLSAYKRGKKVFIIGNGGSAATASHLACDLGKGTLRRVYESNTPKSRAQNPSDF